MNRIDGTLLEIMIYNPFKSVHYVLKLSLSKEDGSLKYDLFLLKLWKFRVVVELKTGLRGG